MDLPAWFKLMLATDIYKAEKEIKVTSMANTYNQIKWNGVPIPEGWYKILTTYTAKYGLKIEITQAEEGFLYIIDVAAGGQYAQFAITKNAAMEDVKCMVLQQQLENAVKSMGLEDYKSKEAAYKSLAIGGYTIGGGVASTSALSQLYSTNAPKPSGWGKYSGKLTSLYEMYGMVDPKPNRYCAKHRPTAAQVWAKIQEAEKQAEVAKTFKTMSPELKETFAKVAEKYMVNGKDFIKYYEQKGNPWNVELSGGAISKETYQQAQGNGCSHNWDDDGGHIWCTKCTHCLMCHGKPLGMIFTKKIEKKLAAYAAKKANSKPASKLGPITTEGLNIDEDPEDLF